MMRGLYYGRDHNMVIDLADTRRGPGGVLGRHLFQIRIDPSSQRDNPIQDSNTDFVRPDARIPLQFVQDVSLDLFIWESNEALTVF
jgi:hypothetical protein